MRTFGKVVDASVLVGGAVVVISGVKVISAGITNKSGAAIALGAITLLVGIYAFKEAAQKINE